MEENNTLPGHPPALSTEFICLPLTLECTGVNLRDQIEAQLRTYGAPLRWAITSVDGTIAHVEAVVTVAPSQPWV